MYHLVCEKSQNCGNLWLKYQVKKKVDVLSVANKSQYIYFCFTNNEEWNKYSSFSYSFRKKFINYVIIVDKQAQKSWDTYGFWEYSPCHLKLKTGNESLSQKLWKSYSTIFTWSQTTNEAALMCLRFVCSKSMLQHQGCASLNAFLWAHSGWCGTVHIYKRRFLLKEERQKTASP